MFLLTVRYAILVRATVRSDLHKRNLLYPLICVCWGVFVAVDEDLSVLEANLAGGKASSVLTRIFQLSSVQLRSSSPSSLYFNMHTCCLKKTAPHGQKHNIYSIAICHHIAASLPGAGIHSSDISARRKPNGKPLTAWGRTEREMEINYSVWFGEESEKQLRVWVGSCTVCTPQCVSILSVSACV